MPSSRDSRSCARAARSRLWTSVEPAAPFDRRVAVRQYRRRSRAGLFRRRRHREPDNRPLAYRVARFVIGRTTAFTYKGKAVDLKQIGRELNVRYVLEGSVQRAGNRDARQRAAHRRRDRQRICGPSASISPSQTFSTCRTRSSRGSPISSSRSFIPPKPARSERAPIPDLFDLFLQGLAWHNKGPTSENMSQARGFFERALALDPDNVDALVMSAMVDFFVAVYLFIRR